MVRIPRKVHGDFTSFRIFSPIQESNGDIDNIPIIVSQFYHFHIVTLEGDKEYHHFRMQYLFFLVIFKELRIRPSGKNTDRGKTKLSACHRCYLWWFMNYLKFQTTLACMRRIAIANINESWNLKLIITRKLIINFRFSWSLWPWWMRSFNFSWPVSFAQLLPFLQ